MQDALIHDYSVFLPQGLLVHQLFLSRFICFTLFFSLFHKREDECKWKPVSSKTAVFFKWSKPFGGVEGIAADNSRLLLFVTFKSKAAVV